MPDNSKFWRDLDPSTQNYCLENDIKKAEKKMKDANELREERLEELFDRENWNRLQTMNVKDMSWQDVELRNAIKKKYSNTNKSYDGSDLPKPEGYEPNNTDTLKQMMEGFISIKQSLEGRGYQFSQLKPMSSLTDVLQNFLSIRDSLRGLIQVPVEIEDWRSFDDDEPEVRKGYTKAELLSTRQAIDEMLANGEYVQ